jgi:hypothetical protein
MPISIDWATKVIFVPQDYMTFLSAGLYELDVDDFRLDLKDIEDSEEGLPFLDTHRHNTAVTLAGATYARTVEIINGYTVEFEEQTAPYTIVCVGANHNIGDVKVVNNVSLIIGNSAGLVVVSGGSGEGGLTDEEHTQLMGLPAASAIATAVWGATTRTLTSFGSLATSVWSVATRTLTTTDFLTTAQNNQLMGLPSAASIATAVWAAGTRTLTSFGSLVTDIWGAGTRTLTGFGTLVTSIWSAGTRTLTTTDFLTVGQNSQLMGLPSAATIATAVWGASTRTLSSFGGLVASIWSNTSRTLTETFGGLTTDEHNHLMGLSNTDLSTLTTATSQLLGLSGQNIKWSDIDHNASSLMTGARITQYTDETLTTPVRSWDIVASYNMSGEITAYRMVEV